MTPPGTPALTCHAARNVRRDWPTLSARSIMRALAASAATVLLVSRER